MRNYTCFLERTLFWYIREIFDVTVIKKTKNEKVYKMIFFDFLSKKNNGFFEFHLLKENLEAIDSATALAESGDDVLDGDGLALGVFSVGGGISDDTVDEAAEDVTDFTVDGTSDALDTTTASEAADGALRDGGGVSLEDLLDALASTSGLTLGHFGVLFLGDFEKGVRTLVSRRNLIVQNSLSRNIFKFITKC